MCIRDSIYAALCAAITQQANILNIGTEGIMLVGAFTAVAVSFFTGSWLAGVIAAMVGGSVIAMIMALGHIKYNSEICAIGMGINLLAIAVTKFLMQVLFKTCLLYTSLSGKKNRFISALRDFSLTRLWP